MEKGVFQLTKRLSIQKLLEYHNKQHICIRYIHRSIGAQVMSTIPPQKRQKQRASKTPEAFSFTFPDH